MDSWEDGWTANMKCNCLLMFLWSYSHCESLNHASLVLWSLAKNGKAWKDVFSSVPQDSESSMSFQAHLPLENDCALWCMKPCCLEHVNKICPVIGLIQKVQNKLGYAEVTKKNTKKTLWPKASKVSFIVQVAWHWGSAGGHVQHCLHAGNKAEKWPLFFTWKHIKGNKADNVALTKRNNHNS